MSSWQYASAELDSLAEARNYYGWVMEHFGPHLGRSVVEVGAGIGTFAEYLLAHPGVEALTLVEPAENNYERLEPRFADNPAVRTVHGYLGDLAGREIADSVVAVNVLEHVEDDLAFLRDARRLLRPTGKLLIFVPALPVIYGQLDRVFEHYRRYTRTSLGAALDAAGLRVRDLRYTNLPGVLSWFVAGRVLRQTTISPQAIRTYDRLVMPWVTRVERVVSPPVGQSLIAIATP